MDLHAYAFHAARVAGPSLTCISEAQAALAKQRYAEVTQQRARQFGALESSIILAQLISNAQWADALVAEIEGLKDFIRCARLAGADAVRVLRDDALRLQFVDEARRRKGL